MVEGEGELHSLLIRVRGEWKSWLETQHWKTWIIKVMSSAYLRLLTFVPAILVSACASSSLAFHVMYFAYNLNKQSDNAQYWHSPFPILNQFIETCLVLTVDSWLVGFTEAGRVVWYYHLFKNSAQFVVIHPVKGFSIVDEADVFLEFSCFSVIQRM